MISDVMFEMVQGVRSYLTSPTFDDVYSGELRDRIITLALDAEALRAELDTPLPLSAVEEDIAIGRLLLWAELNGIDRADLAAEFAQKAKGALGVLEPLLKQSIPAAARAHLEAAIECCRNAAALLDAEPTAVHG